MSGLEIALNEIQSAYLTHFLIRVRLVPGNVVMVATDMYAKSPYGSGHTRLRKSMTFLPFFFRFSVIAFIISVMFLLCTIVLPFPEIYIKVDLFRNVRYIYFFVIVIIFFVYDDNRYGTVAMSGVEPLLTIIYRF